MAHASLLASGVGFHLLYLTSFEYNPTFSETELLGTWSGKAGRLVLTPNDIKQDGDFYVIVQGRRYRVARAFGHLYLLEREDPDSSSVEYRKL